MRDRQVPQDGGILGRWHKVHYAVDRDGRYTLVPSVGDEPVNVANAQAWEVVHRRIDLARRRMIGGEASPLAVYMAASQMDVGLLSRYVGIARWRVRRHLRPGVFARLSHLVLERYAKVFGVSVDRLRSPLPDSPEREHER